MLYFVVIVSRYWINEFDFFKVLGNKMIEIYWYNIKIEC